MAHLSSAGLLLALSFLPGVARAGGLELLPGGAASVGRGGAVAARPEDPMTLMTNPAGLAMLHGHQVLVGFDTPASHMCVDPYGYYGWGVYNAARSEFGDPVAVDNAQKPTIGATYATTKLGRVCNSARSVSIPQLAWAGKITERFALGAGFLAPIVVPGLQFGGPDGTVQTPNGPRPTPTRYSLVKQEATYALAPVVGAAYRFLPWLSAGLSVQVIMLRAEATEVQNAVSGTQPSTDWLAKVTTQDFFVPAAILGVHARPIDAIDLMAAFRWSDDFHGSGDVVYETNTFQRGATTGPVPYRNPAIQLSDVAVRLPWKLTTGARYAGLLRGKRGRGDPLDTELWDVEVDFEVDLNARASVSSLSVGQDVTVVTKDASGKSGSNTVRAQDLAAFNIDRHLKDSYAVRLGGSYAVSPRKVAINGGAFLESRGVDPAYADVDTFAFQRVGLGGGVLMRFGALDLRASYGHIFSETLDLAPPPAQPLEKAVPGDPRSGFDTQVGGTFVGGTRTGGTPLADPSAPDPSKASAVAARTQTSAIATSSRPDRVINAGKYTAAFDIVSVGLSYHF